MFTAYLVVTCLAAAANALSATLDLIRFKQILVIMVKAGVTESWLTTLGILGLIDCGAQPMRSQNRG